MRIYNEYGGTAVAARKGRVGGAACGVGEKSLDRTVGRVLKVLGDGIIIVTIFFVLTVAVVRNVSAVWPHELEPVMEFADFLESQFGIAWWGVVPVLGIVLGWALGGVGKREIAKAGVRWGGYH